MLFEEKGLNALRHRLINPDQVAKIDYRKQCLGNDLDILNKSQEILKSFDNLLHNVTLAPRILRDHFNETNAKIFADNTKILFTERLSRFFLYKSDHVNYTHFVTAFSNKLNQAAPSLFVWDVAKVGGRSCLLPF